MRKERINLYLDEETIDKLKQYAEENKRSASQAVTDWVMTLRVSKTTVSTKYGEVTKNERRQTE